MQKLWITCPICRIPHQVAGELIKDHHQEYQYYKKLRGIITEEVVTHDKDGHQFWIHMFDCPKCVDHLCIIDGCGEKEDVYGLCRNHRGQCGRCGTKTREYFCESDRCQWTDTHPSPLDCGQCRVIGKLYCAEHLQGDTPLTPVSDSAQGNQTIHSTKKF